jgi:hypothetical protein
MKVNIIIGGFQKCGTSALHLFLSKHPDVIVSNPKELDYFNCQAQYDKGTEYYHSFFKKPSIFRLKATNYLESSPSYFSYGDVALTAQRIFEYNHKIKLIALTRNPIDRAFSAWNMYKRRFENGDVDWWFKWFEQREGSTPLAKRRTEKEYKNFSLFIKNELWALKNNQAIECPILKNGEYETGLCVFKEKFKNQVLVVDNESLAKNTEKELNKIASFLELKSYDWSSVKNLKIFKGVYDSNMEDDSYNLLNRYFNSNHENLKR